MEFKTKRLSVDREAIAPDGSDVRKLLTLEGGGMAHFELPSGQISVAVAHRIVEEIWFFLSSRGAMWRKQDDSELKVPVELNVCHTTQ
jgi:mannose-6-phosphate isomerase-like protein (cupin superfamily)